MKHIVKNCKSETNFDKNIYSIYNTEDKTQMEIELTAKKALELSVVLELEPVSPIYAYTEGMFNYKNIKT